MSLLGTTAALVLIGVGATTWRKAAAQKRPVWPGVGWTAAGVLWLLLGSAAGGGADAATEARHAQSRAEAQALANAALAPTPEANTTYVTPEQVEAERAEARGQTSNSSGRTDAQNLSIVAGRDQDDPEIAAKLARLDAACPDEGPSAGDMVLTVQQIVLKDSGRNLDIVNVLDQFITAQEGPAQEGGMKCSETGGMLAALMVQGM